MPAAFTHPLHNEELLVPFLNYRVVARFVVVPLDDVRAYAQSGDIFTIDLTRKRTSNAIIFAKRVPFRFMAEARRK